MRVLSAIIGFVVFFALEMMAAAQNSDNLKLRLIANTDDPVFRLASLEDLGPLAQVENWLKAREFESTIEPYTNKNAPNSNVWDMNLRGLVSGNSREESLSRSASFFANLAKQSGVSVEPVFVFDRSENNFFGPTNLNRSFVSFNVQKNEELTLEALSSIISVTRNGRIYDEFDLLALEVERKLTKDAFAAFAICEIECDEIEISDLKEQLSDVADIRVVSGQKLVGLEPEKKAGSSQESRIEPREALDIEIVDATNGNPSNSLWYIAVSEKCPLPDFLGPIVAIKSGSGKVDFPTSGDRVCLFAALKKEDLVGMAYCRSVRTDWPLSLTVEEISDFTLFCEPPKTKIALSLYIHDLSKRVVSVGQTPEEVTKILRELFDAGQSIRKRDGGIVLEPEVDVDYNTLLALREDARKEIFRENEYDIDSEFNEDGGEPLLTVRMYSKFHELNKFSLVLVSSGSDERYLNCQPVLRLASGKSWPLIIDPVSETYKLPAGEGIKLKATDLDGIQIDLGDETACRSEGKREVSLLRDDVLTGQAEFELEVAKRTLVVVLSAHAPRFQATGLAEAPMSQTARELLRSIAVYAMTNRAFPYERMAVSGVMGPGAGLQTDLEQVNGSNEIAAHFSAPDWLSGAYSRFDDLFYAANQEAKRLQFNFEYLGILKSALGIDRSARFPSSDVLLVFFGENEGTIHDSICSLFKEDRKGKTAAGALKQGGYVPGETRVFVISLASNEDTDFSSRSINNFSDGASCLMAQSWTDLGFDAYTLNAEMLAGRSGRSKGVKSAVDAMARHFN